MMRRFLPVAFAVGVLIVGITAVSVAVPGQSGILPRQVSRSTNFAQATYRQPDAHEDGTDGALRIVGDNLTVDFHGATLEGTAQASEPDARRGTGIYIRGRNVTLRNARVRGYKIGLFAEKSPGLKLIDCDFSYNYKPRLKSTPEREDLSDWMSYHHNEKREWLRYGAGAYLEDCAGFLVKRCRATGGQNGLMLTRCERGQVLGCDFSFLSGIGLGLYRSSRNLVQQNRIDWCVRGYSHGVYNRGQDSAGILVYEQSNRNTFVYNSVTHGGDGFFLWAGQTTMDTGQGGCNDNLLVGNDFSSAPTNGIEVTFSRNRIIGNRIRDCWHGIWGGYSYETEIQGNDFGYNATGIAIEHGQHNRIVGNRFVGDREAIALWQNQTQDPDWGYPKHHDTQSHDYTIAGNVFGTYGDALRIVRTEQVNQSGNREETVWQTLPPVMEASGAPILSAERDWQSYARRFGTAWLPYQAGQTTIVPQNGLPDPLRENARAGSAARQGRRFIVVDEWGPYDFKRPLLWPAPPAKYTVDQPMLFYVWAPEGKYHVVSDGGAQIIKGGSGTSDGLYPVPVLLQITPDNTGIASITMEFRGAATTDYRGIETPAGKAVYFGWKRAVFSMDWDVRFYRWDKDKSDPRTQASAFADVLTTAPLATLSTHDLNLAGYGKFAPGVPADYFATTAEGTVRVPGGEYVLDITTDDGCRVWVDDKPVLTSAWKYQAPTAYPIALTLAKGTHHIRIEHFQIDGYAQLTAALRPK